MVNYPSHSQRSDSYELMTKRSRHRRARRVEDCPAPSISALLAVKGSEMDIHWEVGVSLTLAQIELLLTERLRGVEASEQSLRAPKAREGPTQAPLRGAHRRRGQDERLQTPLHSLPRP